MPERRQAHEWIDAPADLLQGLYPVRIDGLEEGHDGANARTLRSRLERAVTDYVETTGVEGLQLRLTAGDGNGLGAEEESDPGRPSYETLRDRDAGSTPDRATRFVPISPQATFERLAVEANTMDRLLTAVATLSVRHRVFEEWNLKLIEPHPSAAINFYGSPGTGKTLAAHAIAHRLEKQLLVAKTSQLESMYHGESAKNVEALFLAARQHDAVLFLDEADSLLSRRLIAPSQGSEQAVNAMRSELLLCLDAYEGIVIFATNLVEAYDPAFESRVTHVEFQLPDEETRKAIWRLHLPAELPLDDDVSVDDLAAIPDLSGRDIKRAVVTACVAVARTGRARVGQADLLQAVRLDGASRPDAEETELRAAIVSALPDTGPAGVA